MLKDGVADVKKGLVHLTSGGRHGEDFLLEWAGKEDGNHRVSILVKENAARALAGKHPEIFLESVPCTEAIPLCRQELGLSPP